MTTTVAIHQPNYLPYLGFFHKMALADTFILYDTAQFSRNDFHNRNRIKTPEGSSLLTVPFKRRGLLPIRAIEIDSAGGWNLKHWKAVNANYARAAHFVSYREELKKMYEEVSTQLASVNEKFIRWIAGEWGIQPRILNASDPSERLAHMVREVGGDTYVSGVGGLEYLAAGAFRGLNLLLQDFRHPEYPQLWGPFVKNLSSIDLLLNVGEGGSDLIRGAGGTRSWPS